MLHAVFNRIAVFIEIQNVALGKLHSDPMLKFGLFLNASAEVVYSATSGVVFKPRTEAPAEIRGLNNTLRVAEYTTEALVLKKRGQNLSVDSECNFPRAMFCISMNRAIRLNTGCTTTYSRAKVVMNGLETLLRK